MSELTRLERGQRVKVSTNGTTFIFGTVVVQNGDTVLVQFDKKRYQSQWVDRERVTPDPKRIIPPKAKESANAA